MLLITTSATAAIMALFTTTALADATSITNAMTNIQSKTADLGTSISHWQGDLLGALPITIKSVELLETIQGSTEAARASSPLTLDQALQVAGTVADLSKTVSSALQIIIDTKPKFDKLVILSPVVLLNLELEHDATLDLSQAIESKLPQDLRPIAQELIKPIDEAFYKAIDKYRLF